MKEAWYASLLHSAKTGERAPMTVDIVVEVPSAK